MPLDPHQPVLVGVGQTLRRPTSTVVGLPSPAEMMAEALRAAGKDSGTSDRLLRTANSISVMGLLSWRYQDPAALVADLVGASPRHRLRTTTGGNSPQMVVNHVAGAIQRGELDIALIAGAEAMYTRFLARRTGEHLDWAKQDESAAPTELLGTERPGTNDAEMTRSLVMPTQVYPVLECAVRAASGEKVADHQDRISELWSRFSSVAAKNPSAWSPTERSAEEIATPTPDNRMIGFPYTKLMNANLQTDQAAALILCSVDAARRAGVPEDRWVFPHSGADAHDHWWVSERQSLHRSPAIAACGATVFELAGIDIDHVAHVDLYSCFPSAVQIAANELGLDPWDSGRVPTVTGGLGFAGGPGNNYVTHSIATMADRLRSDPGSFGLVTAIGWYVTKHSYGVWSTSPPPHGFRASSPQAEVEAGPRHSFVAAHEGPVTVEAYTVMHERDGAPALGIVACLTPDGARTWANTRDAALMTSMTTDDLCGEPAVLADGDINL